MNDEISWGAFVAHMLCGPSSFQAHVDVNPSKSALSGHVQKKERDMREFIWHIWTSVR